MAAQPNIDERGFVIDPDHVARQRMIDERVKLHAMIRQGERLLAEYDRIIGQAGYPAANRAFDREYSTFARAGYGFWLCDELHEIGVAYEPGEPFGAEVATIDQRMGLCSWIGGARG